MSERPQDDLFFQHPEFQAFKDHCCRILEDLRLTLYAHEYHLESLYTVVIEDDPAINACNRIDCDYLESRVTISRRCFELYLERNSERLFNVLCHEMCHLLTMPMWVRMKENKGNRAIMERQTQRITNVVVGLIAEDMYEIKEKENVQPPTRGSQREIEPCL